MRALTMVWIGGNAALVGYWIVRYAILRRRYTQVFRLWLETEHAEALVMDVFRTEAKRQQKAMERIYRDAGIPMPPNPWAFEGPVGGFEKVEPRVVRDIVFPTPFGSRFGFKVNAHNDAERAEILALMERRRSA